MEQTTQTSIFLVRIGSQTLSIVPAVPNPVTCTNPRCKYTYSAQSQVASGLCPICRP